MKPRDKEVKEYQIPIILPTRKYYCPGPCKPLSEYLKEYLDLIIRQNGSVVIREYWLRLDDVSMRNNFSTYEIEVKIEYPLDYGMEEQVKLIINRFAEFLQRFSDLEVANFIRNEIDKEFMCDEEADAE